MRPATRVHEAGDVNQMMALESGEARVGRASSVREDEILIGLIGDIYEAALDLAQWAAVLDTITDFINPGPDRFFHGGLQPREWLDAAGGQLGKPAGGLGVGGPRAHRARAGGARKT